MPLGRRREFTFAARHPRLNRRTAGRPQLDAGRLAGAGSEQVQMLTEHSHSCQGRYRWTVGPLRGDTGLRVVECTRVAAGGGIGGDRLGQRPELADAVHQLVHAGHVTHRRSGSTSLSADPSFWCSSQPHMPSCLTQPVPMTWGTGRPQPLPTESSVCRPRQPHRCSALQRGSHALPHHARARPDRARHTPLTGCSNDNSGSSHASPQTSSAPGGEDTAATAPLSAAALNRRLLTGKDSDQDYAAQDGAHPAQRRRHGGRLPRARQARQ